MVCGCWSFDVAVGWDNTSHGILSTFELLEAEKHRQRDGTRRVLSRCLCCESESAIVPGLGHMHEPVRDLMRSAALLAALPNRYETAK